jgi:ribosomal protein S18 acetylase RimI-like enzyme
VPSIPRAVQYRVLNPQAAECYAPLIDFYCGKDRLEKHEVNRTVRRMWAGRANPQEAVILESTSKKDVNGHPLLVGVCGVAAGVLEGVPGVKRGTPGAYIYAIGVDVDYQRRKLARRWRYGNALAQAALEAVSAMFGPGAMPYVFATVKPKNKGSQVLLDEHGFDDTVAPRSPPSASAAL